MRDIQTQKCPLCGEGAKFYLVDHGNRKYFDCSNCKRYQMSFDAELYLADENEQSRLEISKFASQSNADEAAVILLSATTSTSLLKEKVSIKREKKSDLLL